MIGLTGGLTKEWLADGRVLCYRFTTGDPHALDACRADLLAELSHPGGELPVLLDIRDWHKPDTPIRPTDCALPALHTVAVVAPNRHTAHTFLAALHLRACDPQQRTVFFTEPIAVAWLLRAAAVDVMASL